ncbi:tetratricopeptide repeat protein [Nonomuraea sp. ATR24]|uniref:tetratricopeptide repeat protein n=1 Tax=Nonomuraea sp. ATR24 TaxID=1676744 RepID=UPI0035C1A23A
MVPLEYTRAAGEIIAPVGMKNLPARVGLFVGRDVALDRLNTAVAESRSAVVQAVHGLGGIGKSALVAHWATTQADRYKVVWWIIADTPEALNTGLASFAAGLQPGIDQVVPQKALAERAIQWLTSHDSWLLVLDNVTDPAHVQPLLARATTGHYVITSRRATGWHHIATPVRLDVLEPAEAVELFTRILNHNGPRATDGAIEVCIELGHLPLAVEQAAAFCCETGTTPRDYLDMLNEYPAATYQAAPEGIEAERTIARIWHISLKQLGDDLLPGRLLRLLSWYGPDAIPRTLLSGVAAPPTLAKAIGRLVAHNMLATDDAAGTLTLHRLVQAVGRTPDPQDPHREPHAIEEARHEAVSLLYRALPEDVQNAATWPVWLMLLPHVDALVSRSKPSSDTIAICDLLNQAGAFLNTQGRAAQATAYLERAVSSCVRLVGDDHLSTLASRSNLGYSYQALNGPARALPLIKRTLSDAERILGKDHPYTLACLNNVAYAHMTAGNLSRAMQLFKRALEGRERVLGMEHIDTLITRTNLARTYRDAGEHQQSISLFEHILAEAERLFGANHFLTLASRANLAHAYEAAGDISRAILTNRRALAESERILGKDHPETLASRNNLGTSYMALGNVKRGLSLLERTLADRERILGGDHPDTLITRSNCAAAYIKMGSLEKGLLLLERTLNDCERVLGSTHPLTKSIRVILSRMS